MPEILVIRRESCRNRVFSFFSIELKGPERAEYLFLEPQRGQQNEQLTLLVPFGDTMLLTLKDNESIGL